MVVVVVVDVVLEVVVLEVVVLEVVVLEVVVLEVVVDVVVDVVVVVLEDVVLADVVGGSVLDTVVVLVADVVVGRIVVVLVVWPAVPAFEVVLGGHGVAVACADDAVTNSVDSTAIATVRASIALAVGVTRRRTNTRVTVPTAKDTIATASTIEIPELPVAGNSQTSTRRL